MLRQKKIGQIEEIKISVVKSTTNKPSVKGFKKNEGTLKSVFHTQGRHHLLLPLLFSPRFVHSENLRFLIPVPDIVLSRVKKTFPGLSLIKNKHRVC